ncbi:MAG: multifunctional oxoglutarate decarboxylase/oxoglutarate dehydrogenase thiamine pyrophosphate-binding subunit/dihydrolipoyllysine-residue succinyltransferase subunit [Ignavibacteriaceae bacterium]|nr:multifunctional oxoglutarate decarboxylase/oxoglutarate dehydrogenase thiamine pyrophosphate-binding subunit/dihydrolipoyllysine-residue succinyltransferase subunit [Ignavibacteriaceae bacterium]
MSENINKDPNIEEFGSNSWFVEYMYEQFREDPNSVPQYWKNYFRGDSGSVDVLPEEIKKGIMVSPRMAMPIPDDGDDLKVIAGSASKILDNMESSLSIPTATSQRSIPVKLLEENRISLNSFLQKNSREKISFTHIIAYAIITAIKKFRSLNNAFTVIDEKPHLIRRKSINIGIAIDVERKDGSRSLLVPNIKNADSLSFAGFYYKYEELIKKSRSGQIDPQEFLGTTITLTNPGTIGTVASVPRLMLGQGAIIATGAIHYPAAYQAMSPETISNLGISKVLTVTSTYDHRIIQGAESGMFLKEIHDLLLGKNNFYEEIFSSLRVPLKPITWETDVQPQGYDSIPYALEAEKQSRVLQLINMYRVRGHLIASIDPLGSQNIYHAELDPSFHKLTIWDFDRQFITGGFGGLRIATLRNILTLLQNTYCDKIGVEYMHIQNHEEKTWLQKTMEPVQNKPGFSPEVKRNALNKLIQAEKFESFIHNKFRGHKRFSLEGSETVIPVLDMLLNEAANDDVKEVVLGMAHRGRLNVLGNIIGKHYDSIFSEFEDIIDSESYQGSGDVKYHLGAAGNYKTHFGNNITVSIASNPSHLEWVNPVVEGIVRAKQTRIEDKGHKHVLPVLIHGDAAFAGQGVVAETLNLSQLKGYRTGGTIHLIINNQIGFTTTSEDARSSEYASDVAKMVQAPIFHVNGDDPEAALWVIKIAYMYRQQFHKDVIIDLLGYRRHGHNEGDEPGFTQPLLYEKIKTHPSVLKIYSGKLVQDGIITPDEYDRLVDEFEKKLNQAYDKVKKKHIDFKIDLPLAVSKDKIKAVKHSHKTAVTEKVLDELLLRMTSVPENFNIHPKLQKFLAKRREIIHGKESADWATGESLAFASLLQEGTPIRLSGQDSVRGTFSQRHLALTDMNTGQEYLPINHMFNKQANIEALDSFLSEAAVLGFEYGYSLADPIKLVLWEAQFGDFANGAQVIIDNFIVASAEKWQSPSNVVMLLPHGFEGQGPEHSSARLERFLSLCAQDNIEVCNPTTPAQYFHLLRRHMKKGIIRPLIIMTPKSLLRLNEAKSPKTEFIKGEFREVIDDDAVQNREKVRRVILTSGKVYYELIKYSNDNNITDAAIVRLEQYYPYEEKKIRELLSSYSKANKVCWVQEEPKNMGAWSFISPLLVEDLTHGQKLVYSGRPASASPAVGSSKLSAKQQADLIKNAFIL